MASGSSSPTHFLGDSIADSSGTGSEYGEDLSVLKSGSSGENNISPRTGRTAMVGAIIDNVTPSAHNRKRHTERSSSTINKTTHELQPTTPSSRLGSSKECEIHNVLLRKMDMLAKQNELILLKLDEVLAEKSKECTAHISKSKQVNVPAEIKSAVHNGYKCGSEAKNLNWTIKDRSGNSLKHNSNENSQMTEHILSFGKGMYPSAQNGVIMVSIERYFESLKQKEHKNLTGKTEHHKEKMMRYSRKKRKMTSRIAALNEKRSYSEEKKKKVREALRVDMMSSEEENISGDEACFLVKDIPWRSEEFSSIVKELDQKTTKMQTPKSRRLYVKRIKGTLVTTRPKPNLAANVQWAVK